MTINYQLQDKFLEIFFSSKFGPNFYLTGGTALARFYFQHRESVDLDLFTNNGDIDFNEVNLTLNKIGQQLLLTTLKQVTTRDFLQFIWEDKQKIPLKIDCIKDIPRHFGNIKIQGSVRIDSLENIGSNKILAVFGRTDWKDFIDLYFILQKSNFSFDHLYQLAKQKDLGLSEQFLAYSLAEVEKARLWPKMLVKLDQKTLLSFYKNLSQKLFKRIKPKA